QFSTQYPNPGELLASSVAHTWLSSEFFGGEEYTEEYRRGLEEYARGLEVTVKELVGKLRNLDYVHAWALIVAIQWFWDHQHEGIDIKKDPWWTLAFRRQWRPKQTPKGQGHSSDKKQGRRKTRTAKRKLT